MASNQPLLLLLNCDAETSIQRVSMCIADHPLIHIYSPNSANGSGWRIIYKAMTFGLKVGQVASDVSEYERIFCLADPSGAMSMLSIGLDANLAGGERTAPIAATLLEIGVEFGRLLNPSIIAWTPGKTATDPTYFSEAVADYINGGAFPALAVIRFTFSDDDNVIRTEGLTWFSGQEVELKAERLNKAEMARRAVRLIHDIAVNGPIIGELAVPDIAADAQLMLSPTDDGALVRVQICSDLDLIKH